MHRGVLLVAVLACALAGAVAALAIGELTGWTNGASTTTVLRSSPVLPDAATATPAAVGPVAKPLAGNGFAPSRIYAKRSPGVVTLFAEYGKGMDAETAQGSGFVVSRDGYILTNSHVVTNAGDARSVKPADRVFVEFQDHDRTRAEIVGWDVFDDVGLVKVDPADHSLDPVPLGNSARVVVGEPAAAIGSPFGNENSLGVGVVSAIHRSIESLTSRYNLVDAIQTDAPINHGNSGGPLFDARGRVIGINAQIRSNSGNAEGVGFAVPINSAKRSMDQLIRHGSVSYAYIGVITTDLTPAFAKHFHYGVQHGAVITSVEDHSPASAAHLRGGKGDHQYLGTDFSPGGDVIVAIGGRLVRSSEDVVRIVTERLAPGQLVHFTIVRGKSHLDVPVRLGDRPANP